MPARLADLQKITRAQFQRLTKEFPKLRRRGLTLFLGRHYADKNCRIMMLGINPGVSQSLPADYKLQPQNYLLGPPDEADIYINWRNARRCFGATPALRHAMEHATFSFCSPFRTPRWSQTPRPQREAIEDVSRPILQRMLADCQPTAVILAGRTAIPLFERIAQVTLTGESTRGGHGARTWTKFAARTAWGHFALLQVPHFSVFNSLEGLQECGEWLASMLRL